MPNQKVTFFFNAQRQGWSESWYMSKASLMEALQSAELVRWPRQRLLGTGSYIEAMRVSDVFVQNDSDMFLYNPLTDQSDENRRDNPASALYVRTTAGNMYRRQVWLRGAPDEWIRYNPATSGYIIPPIAYQRLDEFRQAAVLAGFALQVYDKEAHPAWRVATVAAGTDGNFRFTVPNLVASENLQVQIKAGIRTGIKFLQGKYWPYNIDETARTFQIQVPYIQGTAYKGGASARNLGIGWKAVTGMQIIRPGTKKVGRAFFVPAGRRSHRS